mmetsp:Transcript_115077/g.287561  ORF Transcript_115077/g.287561 Transcript_115077/m.287561 type:complete len:213 (-) Transcript_115077:455-1093(-)
MLWMGLGSRRSPPVSWEIFHRCQRCRRQTSAADSGCAQSFARGAWCEWYAWCGIAHALASPSPEQPSSAVTPTRPPATSQALTRVSGSPPPVALAAPPAPPPASLHGLPPSERQFEQPAAPTLHPAAWRARPPTSGSAPALPPVAPPAALPVPLSASLPAELPVLTRASRFHVAAPSAAQPSVRPAQKPLRPHSQDLIRSAPPLTRPCQAWS